MNSEIMSLLLSANALSRRGPGFLRTLAFSPNGKFFVAARNTPAECGTGRPGGMHIHHAPLFSKTAAVLHPLR